MRQACRAQASHLLCAPRKVNAVVHGAHAGSFSWCAWSAVPGQVEVHRPFKCKTARLPHNGQRATQDIRMRGTSTSCAYPRLRRHCTSPPSGSTRRRDGLFWLWDCLGYSCRLRGRPSVGSRRKESPPHSCAPTNGSAVHRGPGSLLLRRGGRRPVGGDSRRPSGRVGRGVSASEGGVP